MEKQILATAIGLRDDFEVLKRYNVRDTLDDAAQIIWDCIEDYYNTDTNANNVNPEMLKVAIERKHPKHAEIFCGVIDALPEPASGNVKNEILEQKKQHVSKQLSRAFSSNSPVESLLEEYELLEADKLEDSEDDTVLIDPDVSTIMEARKMENRFAMLPPALNTALEGGPLRGHHIVVYAVTDMGKTLFMLNLVRGFIEQGLKVLYCGNEDPMSDLIERFLTSITGKDKWTIRKHPDKARAFARKRGWERLVWAELRPGTLGEIRSLLEKYKPDVLVVDQLRNLHTHERGNYVRSLEVAAQGMRIFAKRYNLVSISVTQAADSANGKAILDRGDIDSSNVGIPSTADLMLGIGGTQEDEFQGIRTLSFAKNKISGNKRPIKVFFNTQNMRVE